MEKQKRNGLIKKRTLIATNLVNLLILLLFSVTSFAAAAGTVTHVSGPLVVKKADGKIKSLSIGSSVESGDLVITEKRTYACLKFSDGSQVTLKPNTQFKVENYVYEQSSPKEDAGSFKLIKGGLRTITGQIGKRGNEHSYRMKTPTATIGIRGTIYDLHFCQGVECGASIQPGLYLAVTDGTIVVTNDAGLQTTLEVKTGQYVYIKDASSPPVLMPSKPDIPFNLPKIFEKPPKTGGTDCQLR